MDADLRIKHKLWARAQLRRPKARATALYLNIKRRTGESADPRIKDFVMSKIRDGLCQLCHMPFFMDARDHMLSPSIDRINNNRWYVPGNVQVVHSICNRIKGQLPQKIVQPHIKAIMQRMYGTLHHKAIAKLRADASRTARGEGIRTNQGKLRTSKRTKR